MCARSHISISSGNQLSDWRLRFTDNLVLVIKGDQGKNLSYKIERLSDGRGFRIDDTQPFVSVMRLIEYYKENAGLRVRLGEPVNRIKQEERSRDKWEISKESIIYTAKLGEGSFGEVSVCFRRVLASI